MKISCHPHPAMTPLPSLMILLLLVCSVVATGATTTKDKDGTSMTSPFASSSGTTTTSVEQFSCTLAAKDKTSCDAATADDGAHCVWCSLSGLGFCVTEKQAESMEKVIPAIKCDDEPTPPKTDDTVNPPTNPPTSFDPNDDVWKCLEKGDAAACKKGTHCTWCVSKAGFGLCLAPVSADFASHSKWFHCPKEDEDEQQYFAATESKDTVQKVSDFDTSCLVASLEQDQSFCKSTKDASSGESCEWCHVTSAPSVQLCLSAEQANLASAVVSCDEVKSGDKLEDPLDMSCVEASMIQDQTVCESTSDVSGDACEWCSIPRVPYHVCLSKEQANMVSGFVMCATPPALAVASSTVDAPVVKFEKKSSIDTITELNDFDASCLMASLEQDSSFCQTTKDASGESCEWCHVASAPSLHLCLSSEQVAMTSGLISCDQSVAQVDDPTDLTCLEASLLQDESACETTVDTSGQACDWCSIPSLPFHLCLSQEQASMVAGFVTCSSSPSSSPAKDIGAAVEFPPNLFKCLKLDEANCEKSACTWCGTQIGFGLCLANAAAAATDNCPFFDCNGPHNSTLTLHESSSSSHHNDPESVNISTPDVNCWAAGMASDDAHSVCQNTLDQHGSACVWCDAAGSGFGLCLSGEQAKIAGKWLVCDNSPVTMTIATKV